MAKIFISYRRVDSQHVAGRIYDALATDFGRNEIFRDVNKIPPGSDFTDVLMQAIDARQKRVESAFRGLYLSAIRPPR